VKVWDPNEGQVSSFSCLFFFASKLMRFGTESRRVRNGRKSVLHRNVSHRFPLPFSWFGMISPSTYNSKTKTKKSEVATPKCDCVTSGQELALIHSLVRPLLCFLFYSSTKILKLPHTGHREAVWSVKWFPSSEFMLATGEFDHSETVKPDSLFFWFIASADFTIRFWDVRKAGCVLSLDQHKTTESSNAVPSTKKCEKCLIYAPKLKFVFFLSFLRSSENRDAKHCT
jgi:WD40 repeat protein